MTQQYTPAQLEAFTKPYPAKPLILGGNASMDHYETTVWERTVEAMLKRRAEAAPDLARLVLEKDAEIARLKEAGEKLALWAYEEVGADPELTPGLHDMLNLTGHEGNQ